MRTPSFKAGTKQQRAVVKLFEEAGIDAEFVQKRSLVVVQVDGVGVTTIRRTRTKDHRHLFEAKAAIAKILAERSES